MYQHLLVPIDGSPLAGSTVEKALALAASTGARITFFHARADFGATSDGALLHTAAPDAFNRSAAGNSRALLAKAEAAGRAAGVHCQSHSVVSDHPHQAILDMAQAQGCDLIFMASHGRRGLKSVLSGSVTHKVLQHTTLPVLVAAVESNLPQSAAQLALGIVRDEHRSLAAVIHGLQRVAQGALAPGAPTPDFALLRAMLYYIEHFPERLHHPKEEAHLFRWLRQRHGESEAVIADLERQHREGAALLAELRASLADFEAGTSAAAAFADCVARFAASQWQHMSVEEKVILPAASAHLHEEDWREIAQAFGENGDPRFGDHADEAFAQLFTRLLNLIPEQR